MEDTVQNLLDNGITPIGAGNNASEVHKPVNKIVNGRNITFLNYTDSKNFAEYSQEVMPIANESTPGYSAYDSDLAKKQIEDAKGNGSDFVLVFFHYGQEYHRSPNENQIAMSHEVIDYGADAVVGSHPHVTQGIELYKNRPIFYSLGNFIFDQSAPITNRAYFIEINLVNDTGEVTVYPVYINGYLPCFMSPEDGTALLKELDPQCKQLKITSNGTGKLSFPLDVEK